jgi:CRISPR-associated protein Cas5d
MTHTAITVRLTGSRALFVSPHLRAEPRSEPYPTVSAIKGIFRSIYGKPEFEWEIEEIHIMAPVLYERVKRSRIKVPGDVHKPDAERTQQTMTYLRDVDYIVKARIVPNPLRTTRDAWSYTQEAIKRMRRGEQFRTICFGRMECMAYYELWEEDIPRAQPIDDQVRGMLFDMIPKDVPKGSWKDSCWSPLFADMSVKGGVIHVPPATYENIREAMFKHRKIHYTERPSASNGEA